MEWEKIFAGHMSDKGLISKMHKNSYTSIAKINSPILKRAKDLNRHFSKRKKDLQLANSYIYMKMCSVSLSGNTNQNHSVIPQISWMTIIKRQE